MVITFYSLLEVTIFRQFGPERICFNFCRRMMNYFSNSQFSVSSLQVLCQSVMATTALSQEKKSTHQKI